MQYQIKGKAPTIGKSCFIAPSADLIGEVRMQDKSSVWFNCVLRADNEPITVGENSNIQDGSILHVDPGFPIVVGSNVTVGHKVMLHGCTIGDNSLIGMNAVILNGARIGRHCLIGAGALVTENMEIPDGQLVLGSPARIVKALDDKTIEMLRQGANHYVENARNYATGLELIP